MEDFLDKRIPLAITAALLLQAGTAIWWAATKDAEDRFEAARVASLESSMDKAADNQLQVIGRLARIEERLNAEGQTLERIDKQLETARR